MEGPIPVKIWIDPLKKSSLGFLMEFMRYYAVISAAANVRVVGYLKDAEFYGYEDLKHISQYCVANGRYCLSHSSKDNVKHPD